jgi:ABC-type multidrug transport system fused ATPase/permease subunit
LTIFVGGTLSSLVAFYLLALGIGFLLFATTIIVFSIVVTFHRQMTNSLTRYEIWRNLKQSQIARIRLNWEQIPTSPVTSKDASHPFESDLDITGNRSIHQLLDTSVSYEGSRRLSNWLLNPIPDAETIRYRQRHIETLIPMTRFRDKLILNARLVSVGADHRLRGSKIAAWFDDLQPIERLHPTLIVAGILAFINITLFGLASFAILPPIWIFSGAIYGLVIVSQWSNLTTLFEDAMGVRTALNRLRAIFLHLETYPYGNKETLKQICTPFLDKQHRPSIYIKRMSRIVAAVSIQNNPLAWFMLNAIVPWDLYFAYRLQENKTKIAEKMPVWLDTWYEIEALSSLANFAYLNPDTIFPKIAVDQAVPNQITFDAKLLGHPLIPDDKKVTNDFSLDKLGTVIIITGSNMSGKSTFLRTIGVNLCLAYAGSVVDAQTFETSLFRPFTCIKVSDSINDGISYFYAEVQRLKSLLLDLEKDHPLPLFFLIDEIFRGTNNRERLIGSRSYIQALVGRRGLGMISTHDLELVKLAEEIPQIYNYHFREDVRDGQMIFDYHIRSGPSPTTNALKIMQLEGLPVDLELSM